MYAIFIAGEGCQWQGVGWVISLHLIVVPIPIFRFVDRLNLAANNRSPSPVAVHCTVPSSYWSTGRSVGHCQGGRTRTDKIGVGAGTDIVFPTSKTRVCRTHRSTKSLSAPAMRAVS